MHAGTAEQEVASRSFCIPQDELPSAGRHFDKMDIARPGVGKRHPARLFPPTLQHGRTCCPTPRKSFPKSATDIRGERTIKDEACSQPYGATSMGIKPARVTRNLERRYEENSPITDYAIPPFDASNLDIDGNGVIDKLDDWFDHPFEERFELIFRTVRYRNAQLQRASHPKFQ